MKYISNVNGVEFMIEGERLSVRVTSHKLLSYFFNSSFFALSGIVILLPTIFMTLIIFRNPTTSIEERIAMSAGWIIIGGLLSVLCTAIGLSGIRHGIRHYIRPKIFDRNLNVFVDEYECKRTLNNVKSVRLALCTRNSEQTKDEFILSLVNENPTESDIVVLDRRLRVSDRSKMLDIVSHLAQFFNSSADLSGF